MRSAPTGEPPLRRRKFDSSIFSGDAIFIFTMDGALLSSISDARKPLYMLWLVRVDPEEGEEAKKEGDGAVCCDGGLLWGIGDEDNAGYVAKPYCGIESLEGAEVPGEE
jgi:hypothetical protein